METLQRLTRRQLLVLTALPRLPSGTRGVPLNALARALRIRAPSALSHVRALQALGLVSRVAGKTRVTPAGSRCLQEYSRHHRVAENLFDRLGLSREDTCTAAREIDLALSHRMVERICRAEGHPSECPHGEPIAPCRSPKAGK